jgi:hypothetical protein
MVPLRQGIDTGWAGLNHNRRTGQRLGEAPERAGCPPAAEIVAQRQRSVLPWSALARRFRPMTYAAFWHLYLRAHAQPATRITHFAGSILALAALFLGLLVDWRWLIAAPVIGYGFAWASHAGIEGNRPATFGHPLWSLFSDFRMLFLWLGGRLEPHLRAAGVGEAGRRATS